MGVNENLDAHTGELRFVLNGIKDKGGILNSPVLENGIGTLYINYQGHTKNMFQQIKFKIECFKTSDNSLFKDYTVDKKMTEDLQAGEFEFNCSESCKIVITNIATKAPSITTGFANATIFQSMYYTDYKAE